MAFALDDDGNFIVDEATGLIASRTGQQALQQDARAECRCEQGGYFANIYYGRNPLAWKFSPADADRVSDTKRIVLQYYQPFSIGLDENSRKIEVV